MLVLWGAGINTEETKTEIIQLIEEKHNFPPVGLNAVCSIGWKKMKEYTT